MTEPDSSLPSTPGADPPEALAGREEAAAPGPSPGQVLRLAREARGLSLEAVARDLRLPVRHLLAIEEDRWGDLLPGQAAPLVRQVAERLGVSPRDIRAPFLVEEGGPEAEPEDPRREKQERLVMWALSGATVLVGLWLVVPGPALGRRITSQRPQLVSSRTLPPPPQPSESPYPVLGEYLPEAPLNDQGALVSLRAQDTCHLKLEYLEGGQPPLERDLQVSDPLRLRVKGPFVLTLANAGAVLVEVAGRRIPHPLTEGEAWTGRFDAQGRWLRPPEPERPEDPPTPDDEDEAP